MEQMTRWFGARLLTGAIAISTILASSGTASADPKEDEAKVHFTNAGTLYDKSDLRGALAEFQRAYDLFPSYKIQFNIGQVAMELDDYAKAFQAYTRYLKEGGSDVPQARAATVQRELDRISSRLGRVAIRAADGAEVTIDGARVGYTPLSEPVVVGVGRHDVVVRGASVEPTTRSIDVAGQQTVTVAVTAAVASPVGGTKLVASPESPPSNTSTYVAFSLAAAFAVTAGITGGIALSDSSTLSSLHDTFGTTRAQLDHERSNVTTMATIADAAGAAAIVAAGVGVYLLVSHRHAARERHVQLTLSPTGAFASGSF